MRHWCQLFCLLALPCWAQQSIVTYNTYEHPPFTVAGAELDLARATTAYLNRKLAPEFTLKLETVSRTRLVKGILEPAGSRFDAVVLFLNPHFLPNAESYLWTGPIASDANVLIFRAGVPAPSRLEDLAGKRFVGVPSNNYPRIDDMVANGQLTRENGTSERSNLTMVETGRVDFTYMNRALYRSYAADPTIKGKLVARSITGQTDFTRHLMTGRANPRLHARLALIATAMPDDREWQAILHRYDHELPVAAINPQSPIKAAAK